MSNNITGIYNIGNTCGINALIQCIKSIGALPREIDKPDSFYNKLVNAENRTIREFIGELSEKSNGLIIRGEQNDITEIWMIVYDIIERELTRESFWTKAFEGTILQTMKCHECGYTCQKHETFTMLSLPLKEDLETGIAAFMSPEKNLGWKCDECSSQNTEKSQRFWRLPRVLCFSLQRFKYSSELEKQAAPVTIPQDLSFQTINQKADYKLTSMALHHGNGVGNGHYTALIPGPGIFIDDDRLYKVNNTLEILESNRDVYLLFYS